LNESSLFRQPVIELKAAWAIAKKDMRIYYIKPNIIVSGIMFPLFMFLAFSVSTTAGPELLIPGLIAITILFSASSIEPVSIPIERRTKTFDRLLSAPVSLNSVVLGGSLSGFLYSIGIAFVPLIAGLMIFGIGIVSVAPLILGLILTSFCIASMGTLFASYPTESPGDIMSMLNMVRLPLVFISGVFIPLASIPSYAQFVTYFSPLTYGFDLIHAAYSGTSHFDPIFDVVMLLMFIVIFQLMADRLYDRYKA
jgi:ABC-2 type transport system permease protein